MKTPEWLKELRAWVGTLALLGLLALVLLYLVRSNQERRNREALLKSIQETNIKDQMERMKDKLAQDRAAREAEGK